MEHINCGWCGTTFVKKNSLHKFCTPACKKKSWRKENSKPEFPAFISKPVERFRAPVVVENRQPIYPVQETIIYEPIEPVIKPVKKVRRVVNRSTVVEPKEPVKSKNPHRDAKEKKVLDTLMRAFDRMLEKTKDQYIRSELYKSKEIDKKITKLESKRDKIIKHGGKINKAIRKYVKGVEKEINSGWLTNRGGQNKIDAVRDRAVNDLVDIIDKKEWFMLFEKYYYFI